MSTEWNDETERLRFRERYRTLPDDDLARLALYEDLMPAAREAITVELETRGLRDLSSFQKQFEEDAIVAKAEGLSAFTPVKARPPVDRELARSQRLLGLTLFAAWGLVGVHWWLLGDKTTWRREGALAMGLFWALILTWDPMVRVVKGEQLSGKLLLRLVFVWWVFGVPAAILAVPALGRMLNAFNPLLAIAVIYSPALALVLYSAVMRFARRRWGPDSRHS